MSLSVEKLVWHDAIFSYIEYDKNLSTITLDASFTNYEQPFSDMRLDDLVLIRMVFSGVTTVSSREMDIISNYEKGSWEAEVLSSSFSEEHALPRLGLFLKLEHDHSDSDYMSLDFIYEDCILSFIE